MECSVVYHIAFEDLGSVAAPLRGGVERRSGATRRQSLSVRSSRTASIPS